MTGICDEQDDVPKTRRAFNSEALPKKFCNAGIAREKPGVSFIKPWFVMPHSRYDDGGIQGEGASLK